ncbi:unnamed protein product [Diamesa serratosioi]
MTQFLPPNLLALFAARDPIPYLPPTDKLPHEKKTRGYAGVGSFLGFFEDPKDTPPPTRVETKEERLERRRREKAEQVTYKLEREIATWDPNTIANSTEDPFKTLFVARVNYDTSESKLRREFEVYGPIKKIILIQNVDTSKPRGYAFIEYEHERDMHSAYKHADGKKIDGKRVLVDVERSRTVKGWLPRRLGGGLGGTRRGGPEVNIKHSGREDNVREKERYRMEREREDRHDRSEKGAERGGGGAFQERRRSRSRDKVERNPRRSRSKDRRRRRSREIEEPERFDRRERDRSERSRDKDKSDKPDRKRRRSRSRDKDRSERKRDRKERERERGERGDRDRSERDRGERKERKPEFREGEIKIKEEPVDDYPDYSQQDYSQYAGQVKYEEGDEEKYRPAELATGNGNRDPNYEEGDY